MRQAVPDDNNMLEVLRAAEMVIADSIAQSGVDKEIEDLEKAVWYINDRIKQMKGL